MREGRGFRATALSFFQSISRFHPFGHHDEPSQRKKSIITGGVSQQQKTCGKKKEIILITSKTFITARMFKY